jgi:hypothetical protein
MNIQLIALKTKTAELFTKLDEERTRLKTNIENWNSAENRKKYVGTFVDEQIKDARLKARETARLFQPELEAMEASIIKASDTWSTETLMRRAKFTPDDADVNTQILHELRQTRLAAEIKSVAPDELVSMINDAAESGRLAELEMLRKEVGRRDFGDAVVRMSVNATLADAVAKVKIHGQEAAHEAIKQARLTLEAAQDVVHELQTGEESTRAKMNRVMAEQKARQEAA